MSRAESGEHPWIYLLFISGNFFYDGASFDTQGIGKVIDQSEKIFESAIHQAQNDTHNRYVIYYDSGETGKSLRLFDRSNEMHNKSSTNFDITDSRLHQQVAQLVMDTFGSEAKIAPKLLYFYGEHISIRPVPYRRSSTSEFSLAKFLAELKNLRELGKFDVTVLHSCYMNTLLAMQYLTGFSRWLVLPSGRVTNNSLPWPQEMQEGGTDPENLALSFQKNFKIPGKNSDFIAYGPSLRSWIKKWEGVESSVDRAAFNTKLQQLQAGLGGRALEGFYAPIELTHTREIFVSIREYFDLLVQCGAHPEEAAALKTALDLNKVFEEKLLQVLHPL